MGGRNAKEGLTGNNPSNVMGEMITTHGRKNTGAGKFCRGSCQKFRRREKPTEKIKYR